MGRLRNLLKILGETEIHISPRHLRDRSLTEEEIKSLRDYKNIRRRSFLAAPRIDGGYQFSYYSGFRLFGPFGERTVHLQYDEEGKLIEKKTFYHDAKGDCYHIGFSTFDPHGGIMGKKGDPFIKSGQVQIGAQ